MQPYGCSNLLSLALIQGVNWHGQTFQGQGHNTKVKGDVFLKKHVVQSYVVASYYIYFEKADTSWEIMRTTFLRWMSQHKGWKVMDA